MKSVQAPRSDPTSRPPHVRQPRLPELRGRHESVLPRCEVRDREIRAARVAFPNHCFRKSALAREFYPKGTLARRYDLTVAEGSPKIADEDVAFAGAARQAEMLRAGEVSATELVQLSLDRIARLNPELNAFRKVFAEKALLEAEQAEARLKAGEERPLLGVPIAIKDEVDVAGEVNTHGTDGFTEPAAADSEMVRRLREAGAIIVGLTLMPELGICGFTESATYGVTRNPWNLQRSPGGSSGGSAAAVASGMVPIASAGDGGGSIRIPAASCGLFGIKPQRGRISLAPDHEAWNGLVGRRQPQPHGA